METLLDFANEINKDWIGGYTAEIKGNKLVIILVGKIVAELTEDLNISGEDSDAVEQLEYMVTR